MLRHVPNKWDATERIPPLERDVRLHASRVRYPEETADDWVPTVDGRKLAALKLSLTSNACRFRSGGMRAISLRLSVEVKESGTTTRH